MDLNSIQLHNHCPNYTSFSSNISQKTILDVSYKIQLRTTFTKLQRLWKSNNKQYGTSTEFSDFISGTINMYITAPNCTRWKETYEAIKCLSYQINKSDAEIQDFCGEVGLPIFDKKYLAFMIEYCMFLELLKKVLDVPQGDTCISMDYLVPTIHSLRKKITKLPTASIYRRLTKDYLDIVGSRLISKQYTPMTTKKSVVKSSISHLEFKIQGLSLLQKNETMDYLKENTDNLQSIEENLIDEKSTEEDNNRILYDDDIEQPTASVDISTSRMGNEKQQYDEESCNSFDDTTNGSISSKNYKEIDVIKNLSTSSFNCHKEKCQVTLKSIIDETQSEKASASDGDQRALPIGTLKNGNVAELRPFNVYTGDRVTLTNTCSFDAITQILCCTYCDSDLYKRTVQGNQDIEMCQLIIAMVNDGITEMTYKHRSNILSKCLEMKRITQYFYSINCESTITKMYENIWGQYFKSGTETKECINYLHNVCVKDIFYIELMIDDIKDIERTLLRLINSKSTVKCKYRDGSLICLSDTRKIIFLNELIFISFLLPDTKATVIACNIMDIPNVIELNYVQYTLRGAVAYINNGDMVGHFVSFCRRKNVKWEIYNDLDDHYTACPAKKNVKICAVLYSVQ